MECFSFVKVTFKIDKLKVDCSYWKLSCEGWLMTVTFERKILIVKVALE